MFIFDLSLCVLMATIATGSIGERTNTNTYIYFSFVTSGFIFPLGLSWCWNDGWLQNLGYLDYGGASIVHLMSGVAGFVSTYLIGPRIGIFKSDRLMSYVLKDTILEDRNANEALEALVLYRQKKQHSTNSEELDKLKSYIENDIEYFTNECQQEIRLEKQEEKKYEEKDSFKESTAQS